ATLETTMRRLIHAAFLGTLLAFPAAARAAEPDPVDFLFRIGMLEGHLMIGRELIDAGQERLALPHFGHPVRELYDDIAPWLTARKVAPFEAPLVRLEAAAAAAPASPETAALYREVIGIVHAARQSAPQALRDSIPEMIRICSDTVDAAAGEYGGAVNRGRIDSLVEYHDSRGYLGFVSQELDRLAAGNPKPEEAGLIARFRAALARAAWIVEPLMPPSEPRASVSQYHTVAAEVAKVAQP
ncbi:MAG TPA: hypothetical protein VGC80_07800, partial [Acetobacteraceae bacterium]